MSNNEYSINIPRKCNNYIDSTRPKREAVVYILIVYSNKNRSNQKNKMFFQIQHTLLLVSLPSFCTSMTWKFLVKRFMEEMLYVFLFTCFSLPLILTLVAACISPFPHRRYNSFFMFFFQRNWPPLIFISRPSSFPVIHVNVDIEIKSK